VTEQLGKRVAEAKGNGLPVCTVVRTGTPYREIVDLATPTSAPTWSSSALTGAAV
jgi:hypothetical protein